MQLRCSLQLYLSSKTPQCSTTMQLENAKRTAPIAREETGQRKVHKVIRSQGVLSLARPMALLLGPTRPRRPRTDQIIPLGYLIGAMPKRVAAVQSKRESNLGMPITAPSARQCRHCARPKLDSVAHIAGAGVKILRHYCAREHLALAHP